MPLKSYLVNMDPRDHAKLKRLTRERGGTLSALLRHIVRCYLDEREGKKHSRRKLRGGEQMATYRKVQDEVLRTAGRWVHTCWIAHVKELNQLPVRRAVNRLPGRRANPCPPWARSLIERTFGRFGML